MQKKSYSPTKNIGEEWKDMVTPSILKTMSKEVSYPDIWRFLNFKGRELYGQKFQLYEEDIYIILQLVCYTIKDEKLAEEFSIDLSKGILLVGPVGCGKTSLMNIIRYLVLPSADRYRIRTCRDIAFEFSEEGAASLHKYAKGSLTRGSFEPITYCFDDLGLENETKYFGNTCSVMGEILLARYLFYQHFGMLTHVTTNLNSIELQQLYGQRVRSRMREMFNLVAFSADAGDKRR